MKYLILKLITIYQAMPISTHSQCRFYPTCSNYMKGSSTEYFTGWSIEGNLIYGRTNSNGTSDRRTINGKTYTFYYDTGSDYLLVGFTGQNLCASGTIMYKITG